MNNYPRPQPPRSTNGPIYFIAAAVMLATLGYYQFSYLPATEKSVDQPTATWLCTIDANQLICEATK